MKNRILNSSARLPTYLDRQFVSGDPSGMRSLAFPVRAIEQLPFDRKDFGDIEGEFRCDDMNRYLVKAVRGGPRVCASEWVAAHLAGLVNLPVPPAKIVENFEGQLLFGSRRMAGAADDTATSALLTSNTLLSNGTSVPGLQARLTEAFVYDLFINNTDRNRGNFLCCAIGGSSCIYLIDHARSLFSRVLGAFPPSDRDYGTVYEARLIRERHGFDLDAALDLANRIERVSAQSIGQILESTPDEWLSPSEKGEFKDWWGNERHAKLKKLRDGLNDGSFL